MQVGELFIALGLSGTDKTLSSLLNVDKLIKDIDKFADLKLGLDPSDAVAGLTRIEDEFSRLMILVSEAKLKLKQDSKELPETVAPEEAGKESGYQFLKKSFLKKLNEAKTALREFFGMPPPDKTNKALKEIDEGLKNIAGLSLTAKAAILSAFYAMTSLFGKAGEKGLTLSNIGILLDRDTEGLQRYMSAAYKAGLSNDSFLRTVKSL